ncbi:hypothetical protein JA1_000834 [Spathaspora sp. JA1]|nr:hypothetical protein JA1_000834 [Spathaspora sp. JA1]
MTRTFFSLLTSLGITQAVPTYNQEQDPDPIDLQVKSLLYLFQRLRINKLTSFLDKNDLSLKYIYQAENQEVNQKLDEQFNLDEFLKLLVNDEYRILVDFTKNKFRSYCILSEYPTKTNFQVRQGNHEDYSFPQFRDSNDKNVAKFRFLLFPTSAISIEYIANVLSGSDIYCEHFAYLPHKTRVQFALESIKEVIPKTNTTTIELTLSQRSKIIRGYLTKLAITVQLQRIYQEHIKLVNSPTKSDTTLPKLASPIRSLKPKPSLAKMASHTNLNSTSPTRLSHRTSMANLRPSSPTKSLKPKPSIPRFQLEELYNPVASPVAIPIDQTSNGSDPDSTSYLTTILYPDIYEKSNPADMFKKNDVLMFSDKPINYIESVKPNGFHFFNTSLITSPDKDGNNIGAVLIGTEVYEVKLDSIEIDNVRVTLPKEVLEIFKKVYPKPEIVVIGLGKHNRILMPETKNIFSQLGIQTEVGDSHSAASIFDLLATERPNVIGAFLLPPNL